MTPASRDDVLARYRCFRKISIDHHSQAFRCISTPALLSQAKRLGLASGTLVTADEDDLNFLSDLLMYTASNGRSRAIDRYARSFAGAADHDGTLLLEAMRAARFSVWRVERRHEAAGIVVRDLIRGEDWWLVDEGLEASARPGACLAMRLFQTGDGFAMSLGVLVAIDADIVEDVFDQIGHILDKRGPEATEDRRFAESFYKLALLDKHLSVDFWEAA